MFHIVSPIPKGGGEGLETPNGGFPSKGCDLRRMHICMVAMVHMVAFRLKRAHFVPKRVPTGHSVVILLCLQRFASRPCGFAFVAGGIKSDSSYLYLEVRFL